MNGSLMGGAFEMQHLTLYIQQRIKSSFNWKETWETDSNLHI